MKKLMPILSILFLLSAFFVYAGASPALITTTWNANTLINISTKTANDGSLVNISYLSVYAYSSNTRNSSSTKILINISNSTATNFDRGYANFTFTGLLLDNSNDYSVAFKTTGVGDSDNVAGTTATNVLVEPNTVTAPTSITFSNPLKAGDTITATIDRTNAWRCFIQFGGTGVEKKAMTLSGSTCTYTVQANSPPNSDYQTFLVADDGATSATSSVQSVTIRAVQSDGGGLWGGTLVMNEPQSSGQSVIAPSQNPFAPKNDKNMLALVVLILIFLYFRNKK